MVEQMTRREFVRAGVVLGTGVVLGASVGCTSSASSDDTPVATPSTTYGGEGTVSKRVLVGYATGKGSTVGVAEEIGKALGERGYSVDVRPMKEQPALHGYDAVVLGSAVNGGQWLPEAVSFVEGNATALAELPVAFFCVHAMNLGDKEKAVAKRRAYLDRVRALVAPVAEGFFAGVGPLGEDSSKIALLAYRAFGGGAEGDCRDWAAIHGWAQELPV